MQATASSPVDLVPIEELERKILIFARHINIATYEQLALIAEFDARVGFLKMGYERCSTWLAWRCDYSMATAREKVRVARALKMLPQVTKAFASGELSWSKVREMTRVAGALVDKALDKARRDDCLKIPDLVDTSWSKRQADAFVTMVTEYLHGSAGEDKSSADNYLVNIHVDQSALAGSVGRDGNRYRFPGCRQTRFLPLHHIDHWANGGETALDNLVLLCTKHHTLLHEGGFTMRKDFKDEWIFIRPDGVAVPDVGYHAEDMLDVELDSDYQNPPRGALLATLEKLVNEPPPPDYLH